jgi:hypothetical protein
MNTKVTWQLTAKGWRQLNRLLLIATLLLGAIFALVLTPPVIAGINLLTEGKL